MTSVMYPCEKESPTLERVLQAVEDSQQSLQDKLARILVLLESSPEYGRGQSMMMMSAALSQSLATIPKPSHPASSSPIAKNPVSTASSSPKQSQSTSFEHAGVGHVTRTRSENSTDFVRKSRFGGRTTHMMSNVLHEWHKPSGVLRAVKAFVRGPRFDFTMGFIILFNSIYIGLEIDRSICEDVGTSGMQYIFLFVYSVELMLRFWAYGLRKTLENNWNKLDILLVLCASISLFVVEPLRESGYIGEEADSLEQLLLVRLLRLLRLVRSFRFFPQFKILWGLVNGLLQALPAILSTFALLFLLIYVFACGGVEMITKSKALQKKALSDATLKTILDTNFNSLPMVALTLIRFTTTDSCAGIYEPLTREKPELIFYWVFMLLVISITIMNLITAVLVEHSFAMAKNDSELESHLQRNTFRKLQPVIEDLFNQLDADQDGRLTLGEAINSRVKWPKELKRYMSDSNSLADLFEALDRDHSGSVDREELVEGILDFAMSEVPMETIKLLNFSRTHKRRIKKLQSHVDELNSMLARFLASCKDPGLVARELLQTDEIKASLASIAFDSCTSTSTAI